ncbi:RND transporter [Betaproteobacteria bacterium GR16-43]|nr:RND transporter [Betaproteobacteria bacterium GR16-43]
MFSRFFIDRPIFAIVISLFIALAGLAAMRVLPIAQYPEIAPPVVTVTAVYPGASAAVLESTVAAPIENTLNGVEDLLYISSTSSSQGMVQIQVTFNIGADVDKAALNVNNRVKQVEPRLPQEVRRQGVTVEKGSSSFLQVIAVYSPEGKYDDFFTSNYVTLNVLDQVKRIPGTTNVQIFGAKDYAMRIWLRPDRLAALKLAPGDVIRAVNEQNAQFAAGKIGEPPTGGGTELVYTITTKGRLQDPKEFEQIIIRANPDGSRLRLVDVARVELASKDYSFMGRINNQPSTLIGVFLQPGANALDVAKNVNATMKGLQAKFPQGLTQVAVYDTTRFVEVSIKEVVETLLIAMVLVFVVVYVFLQNWRATLIPFATVPVSLFGTFAGMLFLGYSINTLTLFGMVLAIGIVVDDAIVVMENVERIMREEGLEPREAAIKAMNEVTSPIVAIVLVLCSVFIPIAFLGGLTGELYRQFAVTISIAVVISGIVALTLTPALCVMILRPHDDAHEARWARWFNRTFSRATDRYENGVAWMIRRGGIVVVLYAIMIGVTAFFFYRTPTSLVPEEDQGFYIAAVILPDGASLERTDKVVQQVVSSVRENPNIENAIAFTGFDFLGGTYRNNAATIFFPLKHWKDRHVPVQALVGEYFGRTMGIKEGLAIAFNAPAIFGLGTAGGFEVYIQNHGEGGPKRLAEVKDQFMAAARNEPQLGMMQTLWRPNVPQLFVDVDREKAKAYGVSVDEVFNTLAATLGTYYVNDFNKYGRTWQVLMSAEPGYRKRPEDVGAVYVRSEKGEMIPVSALARIEYISGPDTLERYNNAQATKIFGSGAPGVSSGQAIAAVERVAKTLPPDFSIDWTGASLQEKRSSGSSGIALVAGAFMAFLILAAQYEKWSLPLSVILAVPFGMFGALMAITLRSLVGETQFTSDVYFQIGLVTLIGLAAKNAILIVEYALLKSQEGLSYSAAALEAARLRFRPILMTSLAFIFGVLPLAISTGAGAGARKSVGTGVMGGMLAATFLAIFFVPFFYKLVMERKLGEPRTSDELKQEATHHREIQQHKTSHAVVHGVPRTEGSHD